MPGETALYQSQQLLAQRMDTEKMLIIIKQLTNTKIIAKLIVQENYVKTHFNCLIHDYFFY